jgi:hypothetical protein
MKKNIGTIDKLIRLLVAAVIIALYFIEIIPHGTLGIVLLVFAAVFSLTSLVSFCPLYALTGLTTCKVNESKDVK